MKILAIDNKACCEFLVQCVDTMFDLFWLDFLWFLLGVQISFRRFLLKIKHLLWKNGT